MKSILPSGSLKTKLIIINDNNHDTEKAYVQILIIIKDLKIPRDLKNLEMLKTKVNTLVKKGIQSTMILKKSTEIFKIRITF